MKRRAFTLAEVLLTLAIIGVVSALTLPNLSSSTKNSQNKALLKKAMSTINNVAMMNMAKNDWGFEGLDGSDSTLCPSDSKELSLKAETSSCTAAMLNSMLTGETRLPYADNGKPSNGKYNTPNTSDLGFLASGGWFVTYQLQDGVIIQMPRYATNCTEDKRLKSFEDEGEYRNCIGMIDINGMKGPHKAIDCADGKSRQHLWDTEDGVLTHCDVKAGDKADIFPFVFYDNTVELASNAAKAYLNSND